jgi:2-oxoglutarate ferredoxin oxidoreductase subunit beta
MDQLKDLVHGAIDHKGFACIDILQICATFFNMTDYYNSKTYDLPEYDKGNFSVACEKAREWDYNSENPIALGLFYQRSFPTFEDRVLKKESQKQDRTAAISEFLKAHQ